MNLAITAAYDVPQLWLARLWAHHGARSPAWLVLPTRVPDLTGLWLGLSLSMAVLIVIRYRRVRALQTAIVSAVIFSQVAGPLLSTTTHVKFFDTQTAKAAIQEEKATATQADRDLLNGVQTAPEFDPHQNPVASVGTGLQQIEHSLQPLETDRQLSVADLPAAPLAQTTDPGTDTDRDGLIDFLEVRIDTSEVYSDTDADGLLDNLEVNGFTMGGQTWYTNPDAQDSNGDSLADMLTGGTGNDWLDGGLGNDVLNSRTGDFDKMLAGDGNDVLLDSDGLLVAQGGPGNATFTIALRTGWSSQDGQKRFNGLTGGYGNDTVALAILDPARFVIELSGDEYDDPPSQLEGTTDRVTITGAIDPNSPISKFEQRDLPTAGFGSSSTASYEGFPIDPTTLTDESGAEFLTEPVGDGAEAGENNRLYLPLITSNEAMSGGSDVPTSEPVVPSEAVSPTETPVAPAAESIPLPAASATPTPDMTIAPVLTVTLPLTATKGVTVTLGEASPSVEPPSTAQPVSGDTTTEEG